MISHAPEARIFLQRRGWTTGDALG